jgi:hypothetical protein
MMPATRESAGSRASRSFLPTTSPLAPAPTSSSTIWTLPSANVSVWRAEGIPIACETARAVSRSDETTRSMSRRLSRQISAYSAPDVRTIVVALGASLRAIMPATRFASSCEVQAMTRSASPMPAAASSRPLAALARAVATS